MSDDQPPETHVLNEQSRLHLIDALLCLDCDSVYHQARRRCHCGSRSAMPLSRIVAPIGDSRHPPWCAARHGFCTCRPEVQAEAKRLDSLPRPEKPFDFPAGTKCPRCKSYALGERVDGDLHLVICRDCGWSERALFFDARLRGVRVIEVDPIEGPFHP